MDDLKDRSGAARTDFVIACLGAVCLFALSALFDANELWVEWAERHEGWELDELPVALGLASFAFAWFAYRRWQEFATAAARVTEINEALNAEVAERARAQKALRESEERYRGLVELSPAGILVHADGRILFANAMAVEFLAAGSPRDLIGRCVTELIDGEAADQAIAQLPQVVAPDGAPSEVEYRFAALDGRSFPAASSTIPIVYDDRQATLTMFRDITVQKTSETALVAAKEAAEVADRAKSEFVANMSHEVRTPLNSIIGFASMIREQNLGPIGHPDYREYAQFIEEAGQYLLSLINDILDLSKIEAGKLELYDEEVELGEIIRSCTGLIAERAHLRELKMDTAIPDDLPAVYADPRKLKQILFNLLSNAVKFTAPGDRITVRVTREPGRGLLLEVADTGPGIAAEDIPTAMARFGQIGRDVMHTQEGTGLGLPLTRSLAELHGGTFELESEVGVGTTVRVRLPEERLAASPVPQAVAS